VGTGAVILLCAATFLFFLVSLRKVRVDARSSTGKSSGLIGDVRSGFQYVINHRGIRFVMILLTATSLLVRPVIELLPGVVDRIFQTGPTGLSIILSSIGGGALGASLWLARRGTSAGLTNLLILSTGVTGLAVALSMQSDHIWAAAGFFGIMGVFMLLGNVAAQTLIQNNVDPDLRARVMGLFIVFGHGLPAVGALLQGWLAVYIGLRAAVGGSALMMFIFLAWSLAVRKSVTRNLEAPQQDRAAGDERSA
jgi:MFS family permease